MDPIKKAIERLKSNRPGDFDRADHRSPASRQPIPVVGRPVRADVPINEIALDPAHLEANRIVGHDNADPRSRPFDMLRTQLLQSMDRKNWQIVAVTSPTPGCGKTFTTVNLAFSIARHTERAALIVDMDLQRPRVASSLGIDRGPGLIEVLNGQMALPDAIDYAVIENCRCGVLRSGKTASDSAGWMASRAMSGLLTELRRDYRSKIILLDLPPMLSSDDVITILPQIDCVLLVVGAGLTTQAEIEDCSKHLHSSDVVRIVLNKAPDSNMTYYGSGY